MKYRSFASMLCLLAFQAGVSGEYLRALAKNNCECPPQIICITEPCDYYECRGNNCVLASANDSDSDSGSGSGGGGNNGGGGRNNGGGRGGDSGVAEVDATAGVKCGDNTCEEGEVCCNDSCGICTPPEGLCIMLACI